MIDGARLRRVEPQPRLPFATPMKQTNRPGMQTPTLTFNIYPGVVQRLIESLANGSRSLAADTVRVEAVDSEVERTVAMVPEVVCIQCDGNVDSFGSIRATNIPVAELLGLPECRNIRGRLPDNAAMVDSCGKGGGGDEGEERQAVGGRDDHPVFEGML
ncbi:hypothetical protein F3Y22_tig00111311pilonHSYRG00060 [Hibiscus syriacus]|uniref:Uncharacterized protein n=1 Tax=Hibiscus syriacus TaxID=106335 RepID=A0A6A2YQD1_HIBSY|nr:hypothetical protein F3Y22_tig00111311pilonHSYRG00060 [Hibiscus syriacus]